MTKEASTGTHWLLVAWSFLLVVFESQPFEPAAARGLGGATPCRARQRGLHLCALGLNHAQLFFELDALTGEAGSFQRDVDFRLAELLAPFILRFLQPFALVLD